MSSNFFAGLSINKLRYFSASWISFLILDEIVSLYIISSIVILGCFAFSGYLSTSIERMKFKSILGVKGLVVNPKSCKNFSISSSLTLSNQVFSFLVRNNETICRNVGLFSGFSSKSCITKSDLIIDLFIGSLTFGI